MGRVLPKQGRQALAKVRSKAAAGFAGFYRDQATFAFPGV